MTNPSRKLILPGGSGFLGHILSKWFKARGWEVVVLTRRAGMAAAPVRAVAWDGATLGEWCAELDGADAVVNLAGRSVNCRYHARNRGEILSSRVDSTRILGEAVARCPRPPKVWLNSSTATIYKHSFDEAMDEAKGILGGTPEAKDVFSVEVAQAWEHAFEKARTPHTRKVALRTGMVLGLYPHTVFRVLRRLVRCGLGGRMGSGRQFVAWIHEDDFCSAVAWLIAREDFSGAVNLVAPQPLPNREMMRLFRDVCGAPVGLPASRWMLEAGAFVLRTETELIIKSRRVVPARLVAAGFRFRYPDFKSALWELEQRLSGPPCSPNSSKGGRNAE